MKQVVEASVFWGGDLFAVRYFALGERVVFDDVPKAASVEVVTRVVEAAPKTPRNRWDLPLGALAITAACLNAMVVGSLAKGMPSFGDHLDRAFVSHDMLVIAEPSPTTDAALGVGIVPVVLTEEDERAEDESPKIVDTLGDTGLIAMLGQYRGGEDTPSAPWARSIENGTIHGTAIDEAWGVGGVALSGVGEGGGGGNALGNFVLDRVHTVGDSSFGVGHGKLIGHHSSTIVCTLRFVEAISCHRIPPQIIHRIVHASEGRFRACYEDGLRRDPKLSGRVVTKFVIARDGAVVAASDGGSDLPDEGVRACVQRVFVSLAFPENPDGVGTVTYPIVMTPE